MSKWLRKEVARACPVHNAIYNEVVARVGAQQRFAIQEILEALNYTAMADSIRWDYIVEFLRDEHAIDCIAVHFEIFKRHSRQKELLEPEKFVAIGYNKKAAGWAAIVPENAHLVAVTLKHRRSVANGVVKKFASSLHSANAKIGQDTLNVLPLFQQSSAA